MIPVLLLLMTSQFVLESVIKGDLCFMCCTCNVKRGPFSQTTFGPKVMIYSKVSK